MPRTQALHPNLGAFLDMLAVSEGTSTIEDSDDGYDVLVGGTLFEGYHDHPRKLVDLPRLGIKSTAAGLYQLLARYWDAYRGLLSLRDFGPESQDAVALQQIRECGAIPYLEAGGLQAAIAQCRHIWASLPGAGYGQHEQSLARLKAAYQAAGGHLVAIV